MPQRFLKFIYFICIGTAVIALGLMGDHCAMSAEVPPKPAVKTEAPKSVFLEKIENQRGKPLSLEDKQRFAQVVQEGIEEVRNRRAEFIQKVSRITKLPIDEIVAIMPKIGQKAQSFDKNTVPEIEALMGRTLTAVEVQQLHEAEQERKRTMELTRKRFVEQIATLSGLSTEVVSTMLTNPTN